MAQKSAKPEKNSSTSVDTPSHVSSEGRSSAPRESSASAVSAKMTTFAHTSGTRPPSAAEVNCAVRVRGRQPAPDALRAE